MPADDFRFTTELTTLDISKLDRMEKREVEGLYRAKEYLVAELRERLIEVESERDLLRTKADRLQTERDSLRDRLDGLEAERGSVAPDRLVASLGDALASARDDLSAADYAIGRIEVDLKANVVGGEDGPRFQLPDLAEPVDRTALSTFRFGLRPAAQDEPAAYDPIPDVRDRSLDDARAAIERAGFTVGEVTTEPGDDAGLVIDQFPSPRSVAEPGTAVDLTVSAGPAEAETDDRTETDAPDLQAVDGIGPTYADRLRAADVGTLSAMLNRDPAEVADIARVSESRVEGWFEHAKRLLEDT